MNISRLAPLALFVFKRPKHTQRVLEALSQCDFAKETDLFVFCDGARHEGESEVVEKTRSVVREATGFRSVEYVMQSENKGLANSIIQGVSEVMKIYGKAIVLEDDLLPAVPFLRFMNACLSKYENHPKVFSVSGYNHPPDIMSFPQDYTADVYFSYRNTSWGWACWQDRWESIDWQVSDFTQFIKDRKAVRKFNRGGEDLTHMLKGQLLGHFDSWSIRFSYAQSRQDAYSVYPVKSYIHNIGFDGTGTHTGFRDDFNDLSQALERFTLPDEVWLDDTLVDLFRKVYDYSVMHKVKIKVKSLLGQNIY